MARRAFVAWVCLSAAVGGLGLGFGFVALMDAIGATEWLLHIYNQYNVIR